VRGGATEVTPYSPLRHGSAETTHLRIQALASPAALGVMVLDARRRSAPMAPRAGDLHNSSQSLAWC